MRIDFVITELDPGGAERCLVEIAVGCHKRGDRVRVFSLGPRPQPPRDVLARRLDAHGIETGFGDAQGVSDLRRTFIALRQFVRSEPPELVQTFLFHANVLGTAAVCGLGRVPRRKMTDVAVVGGIRVAHRGMVRSMIERIAIARMQAVVGVSQGARRTANERLGGGGKTVVIGNAVDVTRFDDAVMWRPGEIGWPDDAIIATFVGRMDRQKDVIGLLNLVDSIISGATAENTANDRLRFLLVGDGHQSEAVDRKIARIGGDRVVRMGWTDNVAGVLRASRMLMLRSRYEGMPNVVLEAMAAGLPVVTTAVEGIGELFDPGDPQVVGDDLSFTDMVQRLAGDQAFASRLGQQNRRRVVRHHSTDAMVDAYRSLYRRIIDGDSPIAT